MGKGLRSARGLAPAAAFGWVGSFLPHHMAAAVEALISGAILRVENDLELNALVGADYRVDLILVWPSDELKVVIQVRALDNHLPDADSRSSIPPPGPWRTHTVSGETVWELFNCEVLNIEPRHNRP